MRPLLPCNLDWPRAGPGTLTAVKCRFNPSRVVQPGCTNAQYAPGRAITRCKRIQGNRSFCRSHEFALSSPTIQQASRAGQGSVCAYRGHPFAHEATSSVTRQDGRDSSAVPSQPPISYSPGRPTLFVSFVCVNVENQDEIFHVVYDFDDRVQIPRNGTIRRIRAPSPDIPRPIEVLYRVPPLPPD
jgi:hypothetical protein